MIRFAERKDNVLRTKNITQKSHVWGAVGAHRFCVLITVSLAGKLQPELVQPAAVWTVMSPPRNVSVVKAGIFA